VACPSGKVRYVTEQYARAQLVGAIMSANRGNAKRHESRVYQCPLCHGFHLTSKRK
jgi:hypothetical protein